MLQKLENAYLAILRFVVIAVAGILLVVFVIFGLDSLKAIQTEPVAKEIVPKISEQELIKGITEKSYPNKMEKNKKNNSGNDIDNKKKDPNAEFYDRAANAITEFVTENSYEVKIEKSQVVEVIKKRAESFNDQRLVAAFAKGFADSIEKTLSDPLVIQVAQDTSALDVVNKALNIFTQNFNRKIEEENEKLAARQKEYMEKKAEGLQSFYVAASTFMAFLVIVFLSIIIRIERNLRNLENLSLIRDLCEKKVVRN